MSASRALSPRLKKYLKKKDLSQYTTNLEQFGIFSASSICCLPSDEDTAFIDQMLNITQSRLKCRMMLNEIRRDFKNPQNIIQNDNTNTIDLIKLEPITNINFNIKCKDMPHLENDNIITNHSNTNINDEIQIKMETDVTDRNNNENNTHRTNLKHLMELRSKYGTKSEYEINEEINPISLIHNQLPLSNISNHENNNNELQSLNSDNNGENMSESLLCNMCDQQMDKLMSKDVYNGPCFCDGNNCNIRMQKEQMVYHCNNHTNGYDLCELCFNNKNYKRKTKLNATSRRQMKWKFPPFILKRINITTMEKSIEISCIRTLEKHQLSKRGKSKNNNKRKRYERKGLNPPLKRRRKS